MSNLAQSNSVQRPQRGHSLYHFLFEEAKPYWVHIVVIFGLTMLATPLALLGPLPLKIVVDNVIGDEPLSPALESILPDGVKTDDMALLLASVLLVVAVAVLSRVNELAISLLSAYTGEKLLLRFRSLLFRHVQRLSFGYHDAKGTYDAAYRIQYDASAVQRVAIEGAIPLVGAAVTFGAMLFIILQLSWQLLVVALAVSPFMVLLTRYFRARLRAQSHEAKKSESSAFSVVQEVLTSIRVVKAFGQEEREAGRFERHAGETLLAKLRLTTMEGVFGLLLGLTVASGTALTLYVGATLVVDGSLTLGELLLILGYVGMMYEPLRTLARRTGSIQNALASADRALELLDVPADVSDPPDGRPLRRAAGRLEFQSVSFSYEGESAAVLSDLSLVIEPGTKLGIAGTTGAGKTTLVSLVSRFYDPTSGSILLDGHDLREYRLADLRSQFAIVLQEPVLFSTSIWENISYARPEASLADIEAAARAAGAHDFIEALTHGYDTRVGERGMRLSGGERQRISLARAFLKDAPILILDEPTSSVDVHTEASIMHAMERLMTGRTTLMIAHRLTTLEHCDVVVKLDAGGLSPFSLDTEVRSGATDRTHEGSYSVGSASVTQ